MIGLSAVFFFILAAFLSILRSKAVKGAPFCSHLITGNSMRYRCSEMALSSILIASKTGSIVGGLRAVFSFVSVVFSVNLVLKAVEEAALSSYSTFGLEARLDLRKSMFKGGPNGLIL